MNPTHYERVWSVIPPELQQVFSTLAVDDYKDFVMHPAINDMLVDDGSPSFAASQSTMQLLFHLYMMKHHGEKIFVLEPDVALMLANTDCRGVTSDLLKTPYREQFFVLPENMGQFTLFDPRTGTHRMCGIYVGYRDGELRLLAVGESNKNSCDALDDTFAYFRFAIEPGDLKTQIRQQIEHYSKDGFMMVTGGVHNIDKAERLFNFVLNILLYVCSPEADKYYEGWADVDPRVRKLDGKARKAAITRLRNTGRFLKIRLGQNTRLTAEQRQHYAGGTTAKRTLVMGHWMRYHTGVGRVNEVLKWRTPFWRGVGELSNVPHLI